MEPIHTIHNYFVQSYCILWYTVIKFDTVQKMYVESISWWWFSSIIQSNKTLHFETVRFASETVRTNQFKLNRQNQL